ncbi:hydantoinase B/oxoprolinase family protein [Spirosoma sp. 209]|uniref:hydantoinase B/oxoprolinase family protein n=1 Tax=Spirosoma sp. 209 TaxID=1955701 RepID=UPI00098D3FE5|nr:hydantoinase B/oxoprolinase family protein [Spirosoma sp. 209]
MWQIWIDTGGTFTDGLGLAPNGVLHRTKVLSSSRLRAQLIHGRLTASWLTAPLFDGYQLRLIETGETFTVASLNTDGQLVVNTPTGSVDGSALLRAQKLDRLTVELFTNEEAPVLATRLLTQTPLHQPFPALEMRLGTTRGTNALLERKGARVGLLITKGFRDLLRIGTQQRPNLFQLAIPPAEVLYEEVFEVDERMAADGRVLTPLVGPALAPLIDQLRQLKPEAVAISLLNAYRNPAHEQQLRDRLAAEGFPVITLSTDVSTAPGYVSRTQTAVIDAYLTPVLRSYLNNVQTQLGNGTAGEQPVRVMTSAGGLVRADLFRPKDSLLSGPAGGVIGAAAVASSLMQPGTLTLDMGGTSTDVARIQRTPDYRYSTPIGPFDLQLPSLSIETVAAGGGSICWFDGAQLRVGPQSAGANPGPACYGATSASAPALLTITDVNLLLGKLHPSQFGIPVFPDKAMDALQTIRLQIESKTGNRPDSATLLRGFERIANETMAGAIRKISVAKGFDPAHYSLLVFGGAGGLHGCAIARLLGMERIILPFDGGLLSAYGIGQARIERMAARSVLQPLHQVSDQLPAIASELVEQATRALRQDIAADAATRTDSVSVFLRLQGQEASLEIPLSHNLADDFRTRYQQLYGHYPGTSTGQPRPIDVESLRVVVSTISPDVPENGPPVSHQHAVPSFETDTYPAYDWTRLREGDTFRGPALLLNTTSSAFIEPGWRVVIQADQNALIDYIADYDSPDDFKPAPASADEAEQADVIQLELFTQRFRAIAEEMGAQLQRTAFSTNVKERLDFSCALLDARAELVANAPHIPVHLGSLGVCARLCLDKLPLAPGDVLITNHPKYGGSHLPDVTLLQGVFTDDEQLIGYVINRAHHAEIGGKVPGSMPPDATRLAEEGVVLEPQYVVKAGQFLWDDGAGTGLQARFTQAPYPTRSLAENRADIEAALASLRAGETALRTLVRQYGLATVQQYMTQLKNAATAIITTVLHRFDGQTFAADESLDDGHTIRVSLTVANGRITIDFSGTSAVHPQNLNANVSILHSAILYVLRLWVGTDATVGDIPLNEGLMAPVDLVLPESSFLNPIFPDDETECPAVVGGNTEVSQRLVDTLLKALGLAACSQGTMNNFLFGTATMGYYETIGGGTGATPGADGRSAVHQHMTNTKLTDPEELERRYPVRLHQFGIRPGSGGSGQWRGGDGIVREIEFLEPAQATLLSQHRLVAPYGIGGGQPGAVGRQTLLRQDGSEENMPGIFTRPMQAGERIRIETPGGGGIG